MATIESLRFISRNLIGILLTTIVAFIVYIILSVLFKIYRANNVFKDFPCPKKDKHWLFGHFLMLFSKSGGFRLKKSLEYSREFPKFYITWFGPWRVNCVLHHPETVKILLKGADPKPTGFGGVYRHALPWLGEGLLIAGGSRWARSRRLLTPAFHFDILKPYIAVYNDCAGQLSKNIERFANTDVSFEVFNLVCLCTLDIILRCAFSYETNCQENSGEVHPYVKAVNEIAETWSRRNRMPWLFPDFIFYRTEEGKRFSRNCQFVHEVAEDVIDKRRNTLKITDLTNRKFLDFLDILLTAKDEDGNGLTKTEIRNEVDTFLFEGHDTTASAISWILYSLAEFPEYQTRCQQEIDTILKQNGNTEIQWEDVSKLEYLTQCIKEGMRLHVPVPFIARTTTKDIVFDGHTLPAGNFCTCHIWNLHHNPEVWKDPETYDPNRFSKENLAQMDSFAFLPFSAGPRNCIGQHFAMNEEKVVLAKLLSKYSFTLDKDHPIEKSPAAVMRAKNGIRLYARCRHSSN